MSYTLYIAEKPSAAEDFAKFLGKKLGHHPIREKDHWVIGASVKVCGLRGHLLENLSPEGYDPAFKDWRGTANRLPYIPSPFQDAIKEKTKPVYLSVKRLIQGAKEIVNCADPDDQGEYLSMRVLHHVGHHRPVKRWAAVDMTDRGLEKSFAEMKTSDDPQWHGAYLSAMTQSHADWLYGINMTRACTIEAGKRGSRSLFNVGRVKTPVWGLIVRRELAIQNFKEQAYYKPWIDLDSGSSKSFRAGWQAQDGDERLSQDGLLLDKRVSDALARAAMSAGVATVIKCETKPVEVPPPLPFSLDTLQPFCGELFGWSPAQTLEAAQALYDAKWVTYPRTPIEHIPESHHDDAGDILQCLAKMPLPTSFGNALRGARPQIKSRAFSDKDVDGSHFGIIPTLATSPGDLASFTPGQQALYAEIVRRYVLQFWPSATKLVSTIQLQVGDEVYGVTGSRYTDEGWRKAFMKAPASGASEAPEEAEDDGEGVQLPSLEVGSQVRIIGAGAEERLTKCPKRFTESSLLTAMINAHTEVRDPKLRARLLKKEGIGTPATRAAIIKETTEHAFFSLQGKRKEIVPSADAIKFIQSLPETMTLPDMTAMWQLYFDGIKRGQKTYEEFIAQQTDWLRKMVQSVAVFMDGIAFESKPRLEIQESNHACTACGSNLRRINGTKGWFWGCGNQDCRKTFADFNGMPAERQPIETSDIGCPRCNASGQEGGGFLRRVPRSSGAGYFWGCSAFRQGCKAGFDDVDGKPDLDGSSKPGHKCPKCETGKLRLIPRKDPNAGPGFWGCSGYRDGCKAAYNDFNGAPDFDGVTRKGAAPQERSAPAPAATARPPSPPPAGLVPRTAAAGSGQAQAPARQQGGVPTWGGMAAGAATARGFAPGSQGASTSRPTPAGLRPAPGPAASSPVSKSGIQPAAGTRGTGAKRMVAGAGLSYAERMRRHGGNVAYDPDKPKE